MKQTASVSKYGSRVVAPCIRNAEVGCSSHLRGTIAITTVSDDLTARRISRERRIMRQFAEQTMISTPLQTEGER